MLTLFTIPKPFRGHADVIQRNAIRSWTMLRPECEIIVFGDDDGTADVAATLGVRHITGVACNEYGTPLISDVFQKAQDLAAGNVLCYVNADIILLKDFIETVNYVARHKQRFLMSGQRWNIEVTEPLEFGPRWEEELRSCVAAEGELFDPSGIDYFVFRRGIWGEIPPFAIGRTLWDNWLIYSARERGVAVVDATKRITAIHQNHDYAHLQNGKTEAWNGPEAKRNFALAGGDYKYAFTLEDATWLLTARSLVPALTRSHLRRRRDVFRTFQPRLYSRLLQPYYLMRRAISPLRRISRALLSRL
ncbi:MAG: hypothetical protein M3R69_12025 [Acidobacteriota bacterium]|nr:hypothetical protein [Acidobacteriota bacterium]